MFSYVAIACMLGVAAAAPSWAPALSYATIPKSGFNYAVADPHTGDNKAQSEVRVGGVVKGSYSLSEPDGTLRIVNYEADPVSGFNAVVNRVGTAVHPSKPIILSPPLIKPIISSVYNPILAPSVIGSPLLGGPLLHGGELLSSPILGKGYHGASILDSGLLLKDGILL